MYSTYNEGKYVVTERFKQKNLQTMTAMSKNIYIDKLDDAVDEYNRPWCSNQNETYWC